MNHQTTSSSFTTEPSAPSNVSALVISNTPATAPAEVPPTKTKRKPQSPARVKDSKSTDNTDTRCRHFTFKGRRCRLNALDPASGLCFRHIGSQFQPSDQDLSSAFVGLLGGFHSPCQIHAFLTEVAVLLVQNRISTRRAAVLTYLGQTLLRTLPAIEDELDAHEQKVPWIFDLPRPKNDEPNSYTSTQDNSK